MQPCIEQFKLATGTDLLHVPYRGVGPALNDAVGGQVQMMYDNLPTSLQLAQDSRLRPLGVSGARRAEALPNVPTFAELQLDDMNWMAFFGLVAPKGTPEPIVQTMDMIWKNKIANSEALKKYAASRAALFTPISGQQAQDEAMKMTRQTVWLYFDAGKAKVSPETIGIPRPQ